MLTEMSDTVCESSENVNPILCSKLGDVTQEDLRNVSRAGIICTGIICTSEAELGWMPMAQTFPQSRDKDGAMLRQVVEKYTDKTLGCVKREKCQTGGTVFDVVYV